jgi:exodeoxyribonuclease-5
MTEELIPEPDTRPPLNEQQQEGYKQMMEFLNSKERDQIFLLKGYAGTGKTFLISRVFEDISTDSNAHPRRYIRIAMTAPTNKAVRVLRDSSRLPDAEYRTIHSLLGLKESITESGQIEFIKSFDENNDIRSFYAVVIDEVSMLQDDLFEEIKRYVNDVKIILMGDPAQIPPVGKTDCEPFLNPEKHGIIEFQLTQIMRQADGSNIILNGFRIREDLYNADIELKSGNDVKLYDPNYQRDLIRSEFITTYTNNPDITDKTKTIAWTNQKVDAYNNYIREFVFGQNLPKIVNGERLVINMPYRSNFQEATDDDDAETKNFEMLTINQEVTVISSEIREMEARMGTFKLYIATIKFQSGLGEEKEGRIKILHEDEQQRYEQILRSLQQQAKSADIKQRKQKWSYFWKVNRQFCNVSYAYAITAHKSQGSTYEKTFIDVGNIQLNRNVYERNRILYTAITRAKKEVILIS